MSEVISPHEAKANHWCELLAEQAASGQSIRVFCAEREINRSTFEYWRKKFSRPNHERSVKRSHFIAVAGNDFKSAATSPRIALPNGVTIDLGDGLDSNCVNQFLLNLCGVGLSLKDGHNAKS